jgi:hypothetical protein
VATYDQIIEYVLRVSGIKIHHRCEIADVKARHGLTTRLAHNRESATIVWFRARPRMWLQSRPLFGTLA